jgi:hypothetical protein
LANHDFGILDQFEENIWYQEYEPQKYNCISVDLDVMDEVFGVYREEIEQIKSFACISTQPICGLEESGITLHIFLNPSVMLLPKQTANFNHISLFY